MIFAMRRLRCAIGAMLAGWAPPQDVTLLALRPMPWELDRSGLPGPRLRRHLMALAANGWRRECGRPDLPPTGAPELRGFSAKTPFRPFGRLLVATQFCALGDGALVLSHLVTTTRGQVVASFTSRMPLAVPVGAAEGAGLALHTHIAPARAEVVGRAA